MKKMLSLIFALMLCFAFTGCDSDSDDSGNTADPFKGTYAPVTEAQLTEIKTDFEDWFDARWDTYSGSVKITSDFDGFKMTQSGTMKMHTVPGEERMSLETSVMGIKAESYIKDGIQYVKSSGGGETVAYSMPTDLDELYSQLEALYEGLGIGFEGDFKELAGMGTLPYNLRDVLRAVNPENLNSSALSALETSKEMKIKAKFDDLNFNIGAGSYGFSYSVSADLELYMIIDKDNNLTDVKVVFNMDMDLMGLGIGSVYELILKPYSGTISLPNDLNEANYPSLMSGFSPINYAIM